METKYMNNRGSEWRKWDLQVHTPFSHLNNDFGNDFDTYVKKLFRTAIEKQIAVIGITDYFCIEGYKKIIQEYISSDMKLAELFTANEIEQIKKIKLIPNVEFRLNTLVNGNRVNFHVIFSDEVSIMDIEENFLHELNFIYEGNPQSTDEKWKLKISNLESLGKKLKAEHANFQSDTDLFIGMKCAVVSHSQITEILINKKSKFESMYLMCVPSDEDLSELSWNGQNHNVRKIYIQKSDALISSNPATIAWGLGKKHDNTQEYIDEFKSLKPCIWGSDCHTYDDMFEPSNQRFTWIKAEPTFEGLKQIIYEPEDRVKIQELEPEEKEDYQIIDKVKFIDNSFYPEEILINKNLTTIIGGKSTGKSILLRNIAQTIDSKEVSSRLEEVKIDPYSNDVSDFQVIWLDKQINEKNESKGVHKKIIYIPQSYLNRLVDKKEGNTSIDEIIKSVLEKEDDVKIAFKRLESQNRETEKIITQKVEDLFYKESDIQSLSENIKKIGDKKGIELEIEKLKKEISEYKIKSGMSEVELKKYDELITKSVKLKDNKELYQNDLKALNNVKDQKIFTSPFLDELSENLQKTLRIEIFNIKERYQLEWNEKINQNIIKINAEDLENDKKIVKNEKALSPLIKKVVESKSLSEKIARSELEEKKLKDITGEENKLEALNNEYKSLINDIAEYHSKFYNNYFNAKTEILKQRSITEDQDLEFGMEVIFESKKFQENCINDIFDQRKFAQFEEVGLQNYQYLKAEFKNDIVRIIQGILDKKLSIKNSYSNKEAITKITQSWFTFNYKIKQNGDEISEMSPGKKSFVLLKLLIELDNSKCPILLDQPEDDLDNRSIYNDLVKFIRTKKKERQFIIATHNPNLVVGADSECVVVANQSGDKSKNRTYKFEYTQGSLESSFLNESSEFVLEQRGIQEHVCDILEGGKIAFEQRKKKYNFN